MARLRRRAPSANSWGQSMLQGIFDNDPEQVEYALSLRGANINEQVCLGDGESAPAYQYGDFAVPMRTNHSRRDGYLYIDGNFVQGGVPGDTALHLAVRSKKMAVAELLVQRGADATISNGEEFDPYELAFDYGLAIHMERWFKARVAGGNTSTTTNESESPRSSVSSD